MERLDLTGREGIPVPEAVIAVLVDRARTTGLDLLLIGAAARDLVVHGPVNQTAVRATLDVDVAVAVSGRGDFEAFTSGLESMRGAQHKFKVLGIEIDVVPFGGIEKERSVTFSDGHLLDVSGIAEAAQTAVAVRLPGGTEVKVASLPAQAALKILAWRDRRSDSTKDAHDLQSILTAASEGPYEDATWEDPRALEATEADILLAGPYRAGYLAAAPFTPEHAVAVTDVLDDLRLRQALAKDMGSPSSLEILEAFRAGFHDGLPDIPSGHRSGRV